MNVALQYIPGVDYLALTIRRAVSSPNKDIFVSKLRSGLCRKFSAPISTETPTILMAPKMKPRPFLLGGVLTIGKGKGSPYNRPRRPRG